MKRMIAMLLCICMVLSFAACGVPAKDDTAQDQQTAGDAVVQMQNSPEKTEETEPAAREKEPDAEDNTPAVAATGPVAEDAKVENVSNNPPVQQVADPVTSEKQEETATQPVKSPDKEETLPNDAAVENNTPDKAPEQIAAEGQYNAGIVLVKVRESFNEKDLGTLEYTSAVPLYSGAKWYAVKLTDADKTAEAVTYLSGLGTFVEVDYDYVMAADTQVTSVDVSCNPHYADHKHHHTHEIPEGWKYATENGKTPGGSSDVIIAVIDTGVDYTHLDLRNNIWVNTAEIAGNGVDDDGNGYIDDVYGWDFVGNDKDPMDDNGHGTHVAGIIAAENNDIGGVGIAYGCKVMALKAGNSSGYFNNSDIAEAVQYAYMNGASVINMSFGGSLISVAVEDALENAYTACVLVAAAGNDSACNDLYCKTCDVVKVSYPAALPYVIGVMSTTADGNSVSSFSNYDHSPYDATEYEVYAVGEAVHSTWPGNKYANLNGTSMAAPTVSAIAALLRSYYSDREAYSTKFVQSQIVNTGKRNPYNAFTEKTDDAHSVVNVYEALTQLPKPEVNLYGYSIDDSTAISSANNGNGVMDAGETVRLYISLHNRGGVASNVNVSIDTLRSGAFADPYFTFANATMVISDIGTYSVRESGDQYFEIVVSQNCPNDYLADFNIRYTYTNGMDENDTATYSGDGVAQFSVSSGYHLPSIISEDTVFTNDRLYIVGENVTIPAGVTVTFEEGCRIQFYEDRTYYNSPRITVYGTLKVAGTGENMVSIAPSEQNITLACIITGAGSGTVDIRYADTYNLRLTKEDSEVSMQIRNSNIRVADHRKGNVFVYAGGSIVSTFMPERIDLVDGCYVELIEWNCNKTITKITNSYILFSVSNATRLNDLYNFENNIFVATKLTEAGDSDNVAILMGGDFSITNNIFTTVLEDVKYLQAFNLTFGGTMSNNTLSALYKQYADQVFVGYMDTNGNPAFDINETCSDISALWPYVVSVEIFDKDGNRVGIVGNEEITVRVTFNRPMDISKETYLTFGTVAPFADYRIDGTWVDELVWEGTYTLKAQIENGQNFLKVNNACAAEDPTKTVFGEFHLYEFTIDTTAAMSMNLQAVAKEEGIELTFAQDDYETLLGYNIYRSEDKDGNFVKLNTTIVLPQEQTFLDDNAEPGKTYWYTYTVVLSDFSESNPAGKVQATAVDTTAPSVYHTPVNQGYENNNLNVSCTASDNMQIASVTLYYRTVGSDTWRSLPMSKVNDKYSATIFGSDVTLAGLEYYIEVSDGVNTVFKGTADVPYTVVIKDASSISRIGDVDGNGSVTTKDALMLMQCLNGDLLLADDAFKRADLNSDGILSSMEALRILQYINGKVTTLTM